jgi:hypothetical protein
MSLKTQATIVKDCLITTPTINTCRCVKSELHKTENPELLLSPNAAAAKDQLRARICSRSGDAQSPVLLLVVVHFDTIKTHVACSPLSLRNARRFEYAYCAVT